MEFYGQATKASEETKFAKINEARMMLENNKVMSQYTGESLEGEPAKTINDLYSQGTITAEERDSLLAGASITVAGKNISFCITLLQMYLNGENCTVENCTDESHLHIGDYVDYQPSDTNSETNFQTVGKSETGYDAEQRYEYDANTQWRVLGLSEDRQHVKLISANPIRKASETTTDGENTTTTTDDLYLVLGGAESYVYCESILKKICSIYNNSSLEATADSIKMEDINNALGVTLTRNANGVPTVTYNGSSIDDDYYEVESYTYKDGDYAPEGYLKSETKTAGEIVYKTAYRYSMDNFTDTKLVTVKNMIFEGTTFDEDGGGNKSYWVASKGAYTDGSYARFGTGAVYLGWADCGFYDLFVSNGVWYAVDAAVRPIVSLGANVTKNDVSKTTEKIDTTWDGAFSGINGPR